MHRQLLHAKQVSSDAVDALHAACNECIALYSKANQQFANHARSA
jgi:hypothetical protein